ncbi:MAG TPA: class I tRNA ligase family protein, partial [Flavobacteriales bacterium]|nr:class I tRNA ligase family protein [Flavobacteriales bacterium]
SLDWTESLKESQRNWIGKSEGASIRFDLVGHAETIEVFTTRPDTIFGVSFVVLAPEHELVSKITTSQHKAVVENYITYAKNRSERERQAEVKNVSGAFTGAYVKHPFTGKLVPVWIADYVLAGYGTGAVMAVPCGDQRDFVFAKHFDLPIPAIMEGVDISEKADPTKEAKLINSDFLNGLTGYEAIRVCIAKIEASGFGKGKVNYRLRDAIFGRQRYWGEPIPVYYKDGIPYCVEENDLPVTLPEVDKFLPTETGEPPLARAANWKHQGKYEYETTTMPGWAGSSWYFLRYMDPKNQSAFASREAMAYWNQVDLYIGGAEHATGHLLYFRFWTKFLMDFGFIEFAEPAKKLINQGMIQGVSKIVYRINGSNKIVSRNLRDKYETSPIHVDLKLADGDVINVEELKKWRDDFASAEFILEEGQLLCTSEVGKMSKRWHNVVNPDDLCDSVGADTLRLYEMFLGPLEQHKPWDTKGIEGTSRFL